MEKDIIINGVSVNDLKKQRAAIQQGAAQIIATNINQAKALTDELVACEDSEKISSLAAKAYEALETAQVVSGVSGVSFYLPFNDGYSDTETYSNMLEDSENYLLVENTMVSSLAGLFYNMETQSEAWHSSRC